MHGRYCVLVVLTRPVGAHLRDFTRVEMKPGALLNSRDARKAADLGERGVVGLTSHHVQLLHDSGYLEVGLAQLIQNILHVYGWIDRDNEGHGFRLESWLRSARLQYVIGALAWVKNG